ncbi:hypothetical protein DB30_05776 [Enhygromyxa salina]|uniref:Uncharacterized protein n=1 Tax=Enhygromyxa salina TaxID=215803 RepID=A0A0C2D5E0_9BACT|nr:hypothetical protein [Enhygromyxa salina]KIG15232.1 hypothetical protein DB30_05776 [Enhygromyxa salina]
MVPALLLGVFALTPASAAASRVVFVNTEPVTIEAGTNDPAADSVSVNGYTQTDFDGWVGATDEQKQDLLALLKDVSVPFDIIYTLERPAMGPYDMVVFGSAEDHMSSFGGTCSVQVGLSDCGDASGVSIAFAYWGCLTMDLHLDTERVAFHTLGALGYGWGLENIAGNGQVMSSWSNSALKFGEACANINGGSSCAHEGCEMGQQNSSADLIANLGARVDDGPPEIVVIEPQPGADVTSPFDVVVEVNDGFGGITAQLEVVGLGAPPVVDAEYPYRWNSLDLGAGPSALTLLVTATDADGNEVSTEIPVCLGGGCPEPGDGDGDTGDGDGDGDGDTGDGDGGETGGGDTAAADAGDGKGCAVEQRGVGFGGLLLVGLVGLVRRRRG